MATAASVLYGATAGTLDSALKTLWPQKKINLVMYKDAPLLGMIPKKTDFTGKNGVIAARYVGQQGRSADFATAQAAYTATGQIAWTLTRRHDYAVGRITGEAVRASKGSEGSLVDGINDEMASSTHALKRSLCAAIYGNGGGAIGQYASASTTVMTLVNRSSVVNFEVGQQICASAADGTSGALRDSGDFVTVTAVNRDAGTVTADANWSNIASIAANDYLFVKGDFDATNRGKITGIGGWIPVTAPAVAESFFGVDRSVDTVRLAGTRFSSNAGGAIEETIQMALARGYENGSTADVLMMNPTDHNKLALALGNRVIYDGAKSSDGQVGYDAIKVTGLAGPVKCIADPSCPVGYGWALKMDSLCLWSLGPCPGILEEDGMSVLRAATADEYEWRMGYYAQMYCKSPVDNIVITF
jgi:hypothetical protein